MMVLVVVRYAYDAWGKVLSITGSMADTLGVQNPLRYRGYVYDQETGLYYLQSRYYNPEIGRFINADALIATGQGILGNNMFAYCNNNPVIFEDASGHALKPCTVVINDGDPRVTEVIISEDESSNSYSGCKSLATAYMGMTKPDSIGPIVATIKRDGSYTVKKTEVLEKGAAFIGVVGFFIPGIYDEAIAGVTLGTIMTFYDLLIDQMTVLGVSFSEQTYDRYSITETWTALERCGDHPNAFRKVHYSRTSYYYDAGDNVWVCCGMTESWDVQDVWIH